MKKKPVKKTTALAVRPKSKPKPKPQPTAIATAPATPQALNVLGEEASTGDLGLVEIRLTAEEEKILSEPVPPADIQVLPTGAIYLSHPGYTRWFNRAFGRMGWKLVPKAKALMGEGCVVCPYILYIHGQPAAFAMGEQKYHSNNKDQSYGDAIEATRASALRRCAKQLGVGLELWDKSFSRQFAAEYVVEVWTKDRDPNAKARKQFRLKKDPPFWNETAKVGAGRTDEQRGAPATNKPPAHHDPHGDETITDGQVKRLWTIIRRRGRTEAEIKSWLALVYRIESTHAITRKDYDNVCSAIEHPGPLQAPQAAAEPGVIDISDYYEDRQPGEDG